MERPRVPQEQGVKLAVDRSHGEYEFPPGTVYIGDNPRERKVTFSRMSVLDTRDSAMVRAVAVYSPSVKDPAYKGLGNIVIKFPNPGREIMFGEEYQYFQVLAQKSHYPWFPKPVGILETRYGTMVGIAVTKCEGDKLSNLLNETRNPLTLSEKSHVLRELSKAFIALMDEDIAILDWKKADVIFDRKTKQVSYVDLNGATTISQDKFSPLPPSLYKFYENVVLPLIGQDHVFSYSSSGKKLSAMSRSFSDLPASEEKRALRIHLQNLTLEQATTEFKN